MGNKHRSCPLVVLLMLSGAIGESVSMRKGSRTPILGPLIGHLATGAGLGIWLSLTLIVSDTGHVFEMIVNSAAPKTAALIFVGLFTSILAVGAALTGLIFTAIENS